MNREEKQMLRKELLEGMCRCAEDITEYYIMGKEGLNIGVKFIDGLVPEAFKAGIADRLLFKKIIDFVLDNIAKEYDGETNCDIIATSIMAKFYYPRYGSYRRITDKEIKRYLGLKI